MNKKIALLLAVIFAAGMFPPVAVSAAVAPAYPMRQAPVSTITMQVESELYSDNYDLALAWNLPVFNSQTDRDTAAIPPAVGYPERYKIMYRNRTANEAYARNPIKELDRDSDPNNVIELDTDSASYTLAPGSLYEFRVVPYHTNTYLVTDPDGTTRRELREVSPAESDAREKRVALLTDIKVSAVGRGSELDVTWTNPTWGGAPVFTEYAIMYEVFNPDSEGEVGLIQWNLDHVVNVNDCEPGEEPGTLKTTINANNLIPGWQYHVRVEPLINGEKVRAVEGEDGRGAGAGDRHTVRISNVDYYFAYGDYQYITEKTAFINPMLHLEMESKDMLRLFWDSLKGSPSLQGIVRIEIEEWEYDPLEPDEVTDLSKRIGAIGYIDGEYNIYNINDWRINLEDLPPEPKAYKIAFYQPGDTVETATRTNIVYYNPSMADFAPYKPDIKLFAQQPGELALQLHWLAFARRPYLPTEEENVNAEFNTYIDPNVRYNIYVTDNDANFTSLTEPLYQVEPSALDLGGFDNLAPDGSVISRDPVYLLRQPYITSYVTRDADGNFVTLPLAANKVYFVKIEAVRLPSGISAREPAFASTYIPPVEDLETIPLMIAAPPLRAGEDKGMDYITVEWDIKYLEIYDAATDTWHAAVGVKDGQLVYGKSALDLNSTGATGFSINDYLKENRMDLYEEMIRTITVDNNEDPENVPAYVDAFLGRVEALLAPVLGSAPRLRVIDLSKASYEIHTVAYDVMMSLGGYEPYRRATLDDFTPEQAANSANWVPIDPAQITAGATIGTYRYRVSAAQNPAGPLTENTAYVVYVRPYEIFPSESEKRAYLPNYVLDTTTQYKPVLDVKPTTPELEPHDDTDHSLTVRWISRDERFMYEIRYGERLSEYPDGGTAIEWEIIGEDASYNPPTLTAPAGDRRLYYIIEDLFPDTEYYIWIRAYTETQTSEWSLPIDMRTDDIVPPLPPQGLSPASADHIREYNRLNETDYEPTEENALNIEWMRDANDEAEQAEDGAAYGNMDPLTNAFVLPLAEMLNMYMLRFDGLNANRSYYIRAKTVLTVTRANIGAPAERAYNYIIQISSEPDFLDYTEFVLPDMDDRDAADSSLLKRRESEWSNTIRLVTMRTGSEYDGDKNPEHYPLPTQDFEIIYDPSTQTLTHRFRSDGTDASGASDQNADQRFISRLIDERIFNWGIDLSEYQGLPVARREVAMPYSIFRAFDERKITLDITAGNLTLAVPPGSLATPAVNALPDFGKAAEIKISIDGNASNLPVMESGDTYSSKPQKISAQAITPTRTVNIDPFAKPLSLTMALDEGVATPDKSTGLFYGTADTGGWERVSSRHDPLSRTLAGTAVRPGAFSGITKPSPNVQVVTDEENNAVYDPTVDAMLRVTSKINIPDLGAYSNLEIVSANRFNNLVAAVAQNKNTATVNNEPSSADVQTLTKAKLYAGNVNQENAAVALARLYELKTKRLINPSDTPETTAVAGIAGADPVNWQSLLKAADIGLINENFNPGSALTMGDLMTMLDIIMTDAGM